MTLPVLYAIRNGNREAALKVQQVLDDRDFRTVDRAEILKIVEQSDGIDLTRKLAEEYARVRAENDWAADDYRLKAASPALDRGTAAYDAKSAPATDIQGNPRPQGAGWDLGAYEGAGAAYSVAFASCRTPASSARVPYQTMTPRGSTVNARNLAGRAGQDAVNSALSITSS